jgi:hypothetical protein
MTIVGRLDQFGSMLALEFDETTANNMRITGVGTYYASEFNENIVDIVRDGLVLNLDAGNLSSYSGSGTTWTDLSGRSNTGTLVNTPTYSSANGGSFTLNGTDQYATITGYKGITGTAARTSIIWFKTNVLNTAYRLLGWGTASIGAKWNISLESTTYRARVELAGGAAVTCNSGTQNVADTNWHMVAATAPANGTANDIKIYIDGNLITDVTILSGSTAINTASNTDVSFGASLVDAVPGYLNGNIAVAQIYNRELSAAEVTQNYNALATRYDLSTTSSTSPLSTNIFMRQNLDKTVIVYNEIDEVTGLEPIDVTPSNVTWWAMSGGSPDTSTSITITGINTQITLRASFSINWGIGSGGSINVYVNAQFQGTINFPVTSGNIDFTINNNDVVVFGAGADFSSTFNITVINLSDGNAALGTTFQLNGNG